MEMQLRLTRLLIYHDFHLGVETDVECHHSVRSQDVVFGVFKEKSVFETFVRAADHRCLCLQ